LLLFIFLWGFASTGPVRLTELLRQQRGGGGNGNGSCDDLFCGQCAVDCLGVPGGSAVEDEFGTCCKRRDLDCAGVCNGTAAIDVCGVCAGGTTGVMPGASCIDRPEGCTVWCIISIVLLSTATIGAFASVACVCCWAAAAVDRPRARRPEEYRYGGSRGEGGEEETKGLIEWDRWERKYYMDRDGEIVEKEQRRGHATRRR
jgi:hypothetical protein